MKKEYDNTEDLKNRYIYQVTKHLPDNTRKDIEEELRTLISDMLEEKAQSTPPSQEDIKHVLQELGNPYELADKYRDKSRYLISPTLFPTWFFILKIVLGAVLFGITVASIIGLLSAENVIWYEYLSRWIATLINGEFMAFAWITVIFAIIEWRGISMKELRDEWDIESLPPVPENEIAISIWDPIIEIVFSIFFLLLFLLAPQLIGAYSIKDGVTIIPIFDLTVIRSALPFIVTCMGLSILKNIWELVDRKYSIKYGIFTLVTNMGEIILTTIILTGFQIWNPGFISQVSNLYHLNAGEDIYQMWNKITDRFLIILIIIYLLDTGVTLYKSFKSRTGSFFNKTKLS